MKFSPAREARPPRPTLGSSSGAMSRTSPYLLSLLRVRGPAALVALCGLPVLLWANALPLADRFRDSTTTFASLAVVCSLVGVTSFALNLLLGARIGFVNELFGGLSRMYGVHQVNGRIAYVSLLAHICLIAASRATISMSDALALFLPGTGWTVGLGVLAFAGMTIAIGLTLFANMNHELFVYVQRSFGIIFVAASFHVFLTPGTKAYSSLLTGYLAILTCVALAAFGYRSLFGSVLVRRHDYWVARAEALDSSVIEVTMTPKSDPLRFKPGQFVFLTFDSPAIERIFHPVDMASEGRSAVVSIRSGAVHNQFHPFSITSAPDDPNLSVAVKAVGDYTTAMRVLEKGASARVEGPYGRFSHVDVDNRRQVWIAGGIGVTPFVSMARSLKGSEHEVDLYLGTKSVEQAYFAEELSAAAQTGESLRVMVVPEDEAGFITAEYLDKHSGLSGKDIFICGPPAMIDNLRNQFHERGVPDERVHYELFSFLK